MIKKVILILLFLLPQFSYSQNTYKDSTLIKPQKYSLFRQKSIENTFVGYYVSQKTNLGISFHVYNIFFNAAISNQYYPDNNGWDLVDIHQLGVILDLTKSVQLLIGSGCIRYARDFDGKKKLLYTQYKYIPDFNSAFTFILNHHIKPLIGYDFMNQEMDFGILLNFN